MLRHGHSCSSGFCRVGSASVPGRTTVREGHVAGSGGAGPGGHAGDRASLVSRLARPWARRSQVGGPRRAQAQARAEAVGDDRAGAARGTARVRLQHGSLDLAPRGGSHRAADASAPSPRACVANPPWIELVAPAAGPPRAGTRRGGDRAVEDAALGAAKKNARRQHAWLIFEDESGVSQQPVVRRTSRVMTAYVARQRAWLTVERLPGYAPDLNPVEQLWGNVKTRELANVCAPSLAALRPPLHAGFARVRRQPHLAFAFLRHAGLEF